MAKKMTKMKVPLAGMQYRVTPTTSEEMQRLAPIKAKLVREPDNHYDENAIAVVLLEKPEQNMHVGYLPRAVARLLAPRLDRGEIEVTEAWLLEVFPDESEADVMIRYRKT